MRGWFWAGALVLIGLAIWLLTMQVRPAGAHLHGLSAELQEWMMGLQNGWGTVCCEFKEAEHLADADWDTTMVDGEPHYRVKYHDKWLVVDANSVVQPPNNKIGPALAWIVYREYQDGKPIGEPWVKCFLPGAGT